MLSGRYVAAGFSPRSTHWKRTLAEARDYMILGVAVLPANNSIHNFDQRVQFLFNLGRAVCHRFEPPIKVIPPFLPLTHQPLKVGIQLLNLGIYLLNLRIRFLLTVDKRPTHDNQVSNGRVMPSLVLAYGVESVFNPGKPFFRRH
jgi:hypothetical protein